MFKVTLTDRRAKGDVWRRLAVPGTATLGGLADGVLQAFDFSDTQHLYELRFRDRTGRNRAYHHYECEEGPYADDLTVGELELPERAAIKFHFDFGDDWRFLIQLERVEPPGRAKVQIALIESVGKAPEQYP